MITINSNKCKVKNETEALFQAKVNEAAIKAIEEHNLPITHIRWGRQVKAWGASASDYHVYEYKNSDKKEFWINMNNMDGWTVDRMVWALMRGCFRFIKTEAEIEKRASNVDLTYYRLMHPNRGFDNDTKFKKLRQYIAAKVFADEVTGLNIWAE